MLTRIYPLMISIFTCFSTIYAATGAQADVENIARYLTDSKSVTIRYIPTSENRPQKPQIICIMGDKFKINSNEMAVWYDGTTQWTYIADNKEVSITEPTPDELAEINPLLILGTLRQHYSASHVKARGNDIQTLELQPNANVDGQLPISKIVIDYNKKDYSPQKITVEFSAGNQLEIQIKSITKGINYPHSTFVFNEKLLPKAEIIDLR